MLEEAKKLAAYRAIDENVKVCLFCFKDEKVIYLLRTQNNTVIGIGSGSTIVYAVERLKAKVDQDKLSVMCVPTSFQVNKCLLIN